MLKFHTIEYIMKKTKCDIHMLDVGYQKQIKMNLIYVYVLTFSLHPSTIR